MIQWQVLVAATAQRVGLSGHGGFYQDLSKVEEPETSLQAREYTELALQRSPIVPTRYMIIDLSRTGKCIFRYSVR